MKALTTLTASALVALVACGDAGDAPAATADQPGSAPAAAPVSDGFDVEPAAGAQFGEGVPASAEARALDELVGDVRQRDSLTAVVSGEVVQVCQNKGCWMTLRAVDTTLAGAEPLTVRFKDYGFFMPKDLAGHRVVAAGTAHRRVVPVDELRHYAEDAGESPEAIAEITEPEESLEFIATGVRVL